MADDYVRKRISEDSAKLLDEYVDTLTGDKTLVRGWEEIPDGETEAMLRILNASVTGDQDKSQLWILNPKARMSGKTEERKGTWRLTNNRLSNGTEYQGFQGIIQTLKLGWGEAIDWTEARLLESFSAPGNAQSIAGISNTTSDNPDEILIVRFPNLNPEKLRTINATLAGPTFSTVTINGESYGDTWYKIISHPQIDQDGTGFIDLMLAKQQFTLNAFSRSNTPGEESIGYLWDVPKTLAQAIITAWDDDTATGRSATASYDGSTQGKNVNIILTAMVGKDNLTTGWVPIACDTYKRWHFAESYTKIEIDTFVLAHDSAIGTVEDTKAIMSRNVSIQFAAGKWNALITESSFGPHANPETPDLTITLPIGEKITRQQSYGYNLRKSEIDTTTFKEVYDNTAAAAAVGKTVELRITREDDCSFDYEAVVTSQSEDIQTTLEAEDGSSKGIREKSWSVLGATAAELTTLESGIACGIRKRVRVNVKARPDELSDADVTETEVRASIDQARATTSDEGIAYNWRWGKNQDAAPLVTRAKRKRISGSISANDDTSVDHHLLEQTVVETADDDVTSVGAAGIAYTWRYGKNQDAAPAVTNAKRKRISGSISANDDTTIDHHLLEQTVVETADADVEAVGSVGIAYKWRYGKNQDAAPAVVRGKRKRISGSISANDDATIDHHLLEQTVVATEGTVTATDGGTGGIGIAFRYGKNYDTEPAVETARLKRISGGVSASDDGTINHSIMEQTLVASDQTILAGNKGMARQIRISKNDEPTALGGNTVPTANGADSIIQARFDDASNLSYEKISQQEVEQIETNKGGSYTEAVQEDLSVGDVTRDELDASGHVAEGQTIVWNMVLKPNGAVNWKKSTITSAARANTVGLVIAKLKPKRKSAGYTDTATVFRGVTNAGLAAYGITEYGYIASLSMDDKGLFSGTKVVREYESGSVDLIQIGASISSDFRVAVYATRGGDGQVFRRYVYYTRTDTYTDSQTTAMASINLTSHASMIGAGSIDIAVIFGDPRWHAVRYDLDTGSGNSGYSAWEKVADGFP